MNDNNQKTRRHVKQTVLCDECMKQIHTMIEINKHAESLVYYCDHNSVFASCGVLDKKIISWTLMWPITFGDSAAMVVKALGSSLNSSQFIKNSIKH